MSLWALQSCDGWFSLVAALLKKKKKKLVEIWCAVKSTVTFLALYKHSMEEVCSVVQV